MDKIDIKYLIVITCSILIACGLNSINSLWVVGKGNYILIINLIVIIISSILILYTNRKIKQINSIK